MPLMVVLAGITIVWSIWTIQGSMNMRNSEIYESVEGEYAKAGEFFLLITGQKVLLFRTATSDILIGKPSVSSCVVGSINESGDIFIKGSLADYTYSNQKMTPQNLHTFTESQSIQDSVLPMNVYTQVWGNKTEGDTITLLAVKSYYMGHADLLHFKRLDVE